MEVSKEKLAELKKQHFGVVAIEVAEEEQKYVAYLKRPNTEALSNFNKIGKTNEMLAMTTLVNECWLEGDSIIKADGFLMAAVGGEFLKGFNQNRNTTTIKN